MARKHTLLAALGLAVILPLVGLAGLAHAGNFRGGDSITVKKDETVEAVLFASGDSVEIAGTVNGDVFCGARTVIISGTVNGDIICAARSISVEGVVNGDVRAAAESIVIKGKVAGSTTLAAAEVQLRSEADIRDAQVAAESVVLSGQVGRDMEVGAGRFTNNGSIGRDLSAGVKRLVLNDKSRIGGNITADSGTAVERAPGAAVGGLVNRRPAGESSYAEKETYLDFVLTAGLFMLLTMVVTAMVLAALFPRPLYSLSETGIQRPGMTMLAGLGAVMLTPVVIILAALTLVGLPLSGILLLAYLLMLVLSGPVFAFYIGRMLLGQRSSSPLLYMLVGSLVLLVLYLIPVINAFAMLAALFFGSGMLVLLFFRRAPKPEYEFKLRPAPTKKKASVRK